MNENNIFNFDQGTSSTYISNNLYNNNIFKDLNKVLKILLDLPQVMEFFIQSKNCNLLDLIVVGAANDVPVADYLNLFPQAYTEAFQDYDYSVADFENKMYNIETSLAIEQHNALKKVAMTGKSLELKTGLLRRWWNKLISLKNSAVSKILDFKLPNVKSVFSKFMNYLNSVLGSLSKIFSVLEPVKEFKEMLETGNDFIEAV